MDEDKVNAIKEFVKSDDFKEIVLAAFKESDADDSGAIDQAELKAILDKLHAAITEGGHDVPAPSQEDIDGILKEFDTSNDGKLQLDEFQKFLKELFTALLSAATA